MIESMYLGSGDTHALLSGKNTKTHHDLIQRFVSGIKPYYNSKASPIDALRTGAILEDRYYRILPDSYFSQYVVFSQEMDVFKASLDFAKINKGKVVDFDELKSIALNDFLNFMPYVDDYNSLLNYIKRYYKSYYNQVQEQLFCTGLDSANLVFLSVTSYNDEANFIRDIKDNEFLKVRINRDNDVISKIKERGLIFQQIKDCYR